MAVMRDDEGGGYEKAQERFLSRQPSRISESDSYPSREQLYDRSALGDADPDRDQIVERLAWSPKQRLQYLVDMLAFEERAHNR